MASIELIKASDGTENANIATVQNSRSSGSSTIIVDTVLGINPAGFAGSMGTPHTFTDPVTSEIITVISEATAVDFTGHIDGSNIEIDDIAPGYTDGGSEVGDIIIIRPTTQWGDAVAEVLEVSHNDDGTLKDNSVPTAAIVDDAVTAPKISGVDKSNLTVDSNPYKFRVYLNSAQNTGTPVDTYSIINLDTENFDTNNNFSTSTHQYTAPVDGFYWFNYNVNITIPAAETYEVSLFKNGTLVSRGWRDNVNTVLVAGGGSELLQLTAGDTVDIRASASSARAISTGSTLTNFSGFLVSRT